MFWIQSDIKKSTILNYYTDNKYIYLILRIFRHILKVHKQGKIINNGRYYNFVGKLSLFLPFPCVHGYVVF